MKKTAEDYLGQTVTEQLLLFLLTLMHNVKLLKAGEIADLNYAYHQSLVGRGSDGDLGGVHLISLFLN
jgi:hypothetical protein